MSNPNESDESKDQTLAALHGLGSAQDSTDHEEHDGHDEAGASPELDPDGHDDGSPSSAASGFVGMLAQEGAPGAVPDTVPGAGPAEIAARSRRDDIQMAREIPPEQRPPALSAAAPRAAARKPVKQVPDWYHVAVPVMYTLGSLLILIGIWAVGALIYMALSKPEASADVHYPAITWHFDEDSNAGSYTFLSKLMPALMLICIPVAYAMAFMANMMRKQIKAADRVAGK